MWVALAVVGVLVAMLIVGARDAAAARDAQADQIAALAAALQAEQDAARSRGEDPIAPAPEAITGAQGEPGPMGPQGPVGPSGAAGADGQDGVDGEDGAPGPAGSPGATGPQGPAGTNGSDGKDGRGITSVECVPADAVGPGSLVVTYTDGTSTTIARCWPL